MKAPAVDLEPLREKNPLYLWRKAHGLSIFRAAVKIGVSSTTAKEWEIGSLTPSDDNFGRLASALGMDLDMLRQAWRRWANRAAR